MTLNSVSQIPAQIPGAEPHWLQPERAHRLLEHRGCRGRAVSGAAPEARRDADLCSSRSREPQRFGWVNFCQLFLITLR